MNGLLTSLNDDLAALGERVLPALVQIRCGGRGIGSGIIWRSDGLVVTNAHVVADAPLEITLWDGRTAEAELLAVDKRADVAALRVALSDLPVAEIGDSRGLKPGDWVVAFGHPFGVAGAATAGIVISAGNRLADFGRSDREWIAASLRLRPGHSGGPMVDHRGRVVGINTLMNGPEAGAAVPVHVVVDFLAHAGLLEFAML